MNAKAIRHALRGNRVLMCTYEAAGKVYSLDNGVPVSKKLAARTHQPHEAASRSVPAAERRRIVSRLHADVAAEG